MTTPQPSAVDECSLEQFQSLCEKFLPPETAKFVKTQAALFKKNPKGRRYSKAFKQFYLTLYFVGPKA